MTKRTMIRFLACALLCAMLCGCIAVAVGEARMPEGRGVLTDDADALSADTAADIAKYAKLLQDKTDIELRVVLVHFLDGMDAKGYADALFSKWGLNKNALLVLGAAGEDSFAMSMGKKTAEALGEKSAETLMFTSSHFSDLFHAQRYDEAFGSLFVAMSSLVEKRCDTSIKLGNLFEGSQAPAEPTDAPKDFISQMFDQYIGDIKNRENSYHSYHESRGKGSDGMGVGGWIVLGIIVLIIFGQSDPIRKARRQGGRDYRRIGCGCSPLGWIFSIFGLSVIINNLRRRG